MTILIIVLASLAGACTSFGLGHYRGWPKVLASAFPSLVVYCVVRMLSGLLDPQLAQAIPAAFMGASFCGMSAPPVLVSFRSAGISGLFFALIFSSPVLFFKGYGGALGTMACISVLATAGLRRIVNKSKLRDFRI